MQKKRNKELNSLSAVEYFSVVTTVELLIKPNEGLRDYEELLDLL